MITIERITRNDVEELLKLYEELSEKKSNLESFYKTFEKINSDESYILVGAKDENNKIVGTVMGIICYELNSDCRPFMVIENIVVSNECKGQGVGRKLMTFIEDEARKRNCSLTMLVSGYQRKEAHLFYEKLGYGNDLVKGFKKYL
jgi:phosphoglycolate phosphatase